MFSCARVYATSKTFAKQHDSYRVRTSCKGSYFVCKIDENSALFQ